MFAVPLPRPSRQTNKVLVLVSSGDEYEYLVDFGEVLAFTCVEEGCAPERDFVLADFDVADRSCAYIYVDSPWLKSYEPCHDPFSDGKFSHYMIFGGDNNIEVITSNVPQIREVVRGEVIASEFQI